MAHHPDNSISATLRKAIEKYVAAGGTFKGMERETGVLRQTLMKFVREETSLRLDMADKLAKFFQLELRPVTHTKSRVTHKRQYGSERLK